MGDSHSKIPFPPLLSPFRILSTHAHASNMFSQAARYRAVSHVRLAVWDPVALTTRLPAGPPVLLTQDRALGTGSTSSFLLSLSRNVQHDRGSQGKRARIKSLAF